MEDTHVSETANRDAHAPAAGHQDTASRTRTSFKRESDVCPESTSLDPGENGPNDPDTNLSYDAFGKRRGSNWAGSPSTGDWTAINANTHRGYTDHEQLDNLTLIHLNGRVYDPAIGRFLSADPLVQAPYNGQSLNRYSYVFNNPLSFTDPSGYRSALAEDCNGLSCSPLNLALEWLVGVSFSERRESADRTERPRPPPPPMPAVPPGLGGLGSVTPGLAVEGPRLSTVGGTVGGTVDWAKVRDTAFAPFGGWESFKSDVRCIWECDWPGDGSLEANLAALPFVPIVGVEAITARGAAALVGRSFGRIGTVVQNPGIVIRGFAGSKVPGHAINQIINRGVTPELLRATVTNPTVVLQQGGNRFVYLTEQAAVVITKDGQVVTAWTQREFLPGVFEVLSVVGTR